MRILSPSEWSAQVDYDAWNDPRIAKDKVIVHYGGNASFAGAQEPAEARGFDYPSFEVERSALRIYEQSHLSRGWRGLAYGWAIGQSGLVYRARGWNLYGAHRGDLEPDGISENSEGIPVLFILGGDQVASPEALASFEELVAYFEGHESADLPVFGHQEIAELGDGGTSTGCPGTYLMGYIDTRRTQDTTPEIPEDTGMEFALAIFALWTREDLLTMEAAGYWSGGDNVDWYFNPACPDEEKMNLVAYILANGNKDIPLNLPGPQGPKGDPGQDGIDSTVEVLVNGEVVT